MAVVQTFFNRIKQKQASRRTFKISHDDLDLHTTSSGIMGKGDDQSSRHRPRKWPSTRALPPIPLSPKRDGYISSSSCENIYEEITEEFMKEIVGRKPIVQQQEAVVSSSEDDYGFTKFKKQHDPSKQRMRVAKNIRGMLTNPKSKLFSVKDEEPQGQVQVQTVKCASMAIPPDMLYAVDLASPKFKQVCRCTHQHPQSQPLRSHHSTSAVPSYHQTSCDNCSIHSNPNASSLQVSSEPVMPQQIDNQPVQSELSYNAHLQPQVDNLAASKPQNRNSCTDSITPYFGGGSDSGVSVSSEGSYGNAPLSPNGYNPPLSSNGYSSGYQHFQYASDNVFQDVGSRVPIQGLHTVWEQGPAQVQQQMLTHPRPHQSQSHPSHLPMEPQAVYNVPKPPIAVNPSMVPMPQQPYYHQQHYLDTSNMYPATVPQQTLYQSPIQPVGAHVQDSKQDYLQPTCRPPNGVNPGDEGFSEPQGESSFVKRAREKIYAKLKHLDLAELEGNRGMIDFGLSPLVWEGRDESPMPVPMSPPLDMQSIDNPADPTASAFKPYISGHMLAAGDHHHITTNAQVHAPPDNQYYHSPQAAWSMVRTPPKSQPPQQYTRSEVFTSISLRKGLQCVDTGTLSPMPVSEPPPPLPKRCPQSSKSNVHRPAPTAPAEDNASTHQQFQRSKSLMNPEAAELESRSDSPDFVPKFERKGFRKAISGVNGKDKDKEHKFKRSKSLMNPDPVDSETIRSDSPEVIANFTRQGFRKAIHGRRSQSSENSSTDQSDCEGIYRRISRFSKSRERTQSSSDCVQKDDSSKQQPSQQSELDKDTSSTTQTVNSKISNGQEQCSKQTSKSESSAADLSPKVTKSKSHKSDHNASKLAFKPVVGKKQGKTPPVESDQRLGVRVKKTLQSNPNAAMKPPGQNSALSDLLRRNHDRQLLFVL